MDVIENWLQISDWPASQSFLLKAHSQFPLESRAKTAALSSKHITREDHNEKKNPVMKHKNSRTYKKNKKDCPPCLRDTGGHKNQQKEKCKVRGERGEGEERDGRGCRRGFLFRNQRSIAGMLVSRFTTYSWHDGVKVHDL